MVNWGLPHVLCAVFYVFLCGLVQWKAIFCVRLVVLRDEVVQKQTRNLCFYTNCSLMYQSLWTKFTFSKQALYKCKIQQVYYIPNPIIQVCDRTIWDTNSFVPFTSFFCLPSKKVAKSFVILCLRDICSTKNMQSINQQTSHESLLFTRQDSGIEQWTKPQSLCLPGAWVLVGEAGNEQVSVQQNVRQREVL